MAKKKTEEDTQENTMRKDMQDELKDYVDKHLKIELIGYVDEKIKNEFLDELGKSHKRLIKEKNKKILSKNICIVLLLGIILFLIYQLYELQYFNRFFVKENNTKIIEKIEEPKEKTEEKKKIPSLEELKDKYSSLLDPYCLNSNSPYIKDYYDGNLTPEIKQSFIMNNLDFSKFEVEEDYYVIDEILFQEENNILFNEQEQFSTFDYNGNRIRYINKMKSYMTDTLIQKEECNIEKTIIDIKEQDNQVLITTQEGKWKEDQIVNVITEGTELSTITYVFEEQKLISIKK